MKRRVMMMGLAMVTGLPQAVCAEDDKENSAQAYASWNTAYRPHYGVAATAHPLMDHVSVSGAPPGQSMSNTWQLELASPPAVISSADNPMSANDRRVGFRLKVGF
ncbi:MAG: hypothetical protein Q8K12_00240 [Thiobacillus sp.]|nr:hypothetical protein [Thiobacillus sp.]